MNEAFDTSEVERVKEVIRQLKLALASCHKFLAELERPLEGAKCERPRLVH